MLPHDFPHYGTVYKYFQKWERLGIWKQIHDTLRHLLREKLGRKEKSTVAIADSQSVETTEKSAPPALRSPQRKDGASRGKFMVTTAARK
jgi:putative transposase